MWDLLNALVNGSQMLTSCTFGLTVCSNSQVNLYLYGSWGTLSFLTKRRALRRIYSESLNFDPSLVNICWNGRRGMHWQDLFDELNLMFQKLPMPDVLILHLGGNDIGYIKTLDSIFQI